MIPSQAPPSPVAGAAAEQEETFSPAIFVRAVRKHWLIALTLMVASVICSWLYSANQRKLYEAVATVQLDPQPLTPLGHSQVVESGSDSYWSNQEYFATQHQVITSRKIALLVVQKLGLMSDATFIGPQNSEHKMAPEQVAEGLRARLKVEPIEDSRLARVKFTDADPARAQRILTAVVDTYVEQNLDTTLDATNKTVEWLDMQLARLKGDLESQEMDLHDFKIKYNLLSVSYGDQSNMLRAQIQQLNETLTALKAKKENVVARIDILKKINPEDPADVPASVLFTSDTLSMLRSSYIDAKRERASLKAFGKDDNHPQVQAASAAVEASRGALTAELANIKHGADLELAAVGQEVAGLNGLYESAKHEALELNLKELEYSRLERSKDNTEKLFGLVLERSTESGLSKMMPFNNVRVLDRPLRPGAPVFPKTGTNLAVGAVLGLLLGLGGALGRDLLDRTVRNAEDTERELGLSVLGSLQDVSGGGKQSVGYYGYGRSRRQRVNPETTTADSVDPELLVHTHPKSVVAEAARAIRTNLMFMSPDQPFRCLLVTSAGPAEGKTTVAACIAVAMAQTGQRVCLVDCDLRKPRVHTLFKERNDRGVTTALLDPSDMDASILGTPVANLSVMKAGPTPPNPADLMHTEAFGKVLDGLRARFDRVVIDSPPIGLVTDGVILATRVDATVLVVRALSTRRDAAKRAVRALRDVGANCAGFVLNASAGGGRYYYSGYYAPYGATEQESSAS
ncbi:MAG TPA: polysaccharide biosynthesis tyrosine autokinase [Polyangiaceae bacterium]|jgi:capsular exopolysaccharide synthesis family protein